MAGAPIIRINPNVTLLRERISDSEFCIVIDNFLQDPYALVEFAAQHSGDFAQPTSAYPGVQGAISDDATIDLARFIRSKLSKLFPFHRGGMSLRTYLSMVTRAPNELSVMQRICHIDPNPDPDRAKYAALVYLFKDERLGGTSFYRWRDQELMWKAADTMREDPDKGLEILHENFQTFREPPKYMTESNDIAELLCTVPPAFNRMVFYSGDVPHSGAITAPELLCDDLRTGRLTLNLFVSASPR